MRPLGRIGRLRILVHALLSCAASAQTVWVVDDDGPGDFATLQEAVDAAAPGDVIRVRADLPRQPHPVAPIELGVVEIDGKGLVIVGEGSPRPRIAYRIVVRNVPADQNVTIRSARLGYYRIVADYGPISPPTLELEANAGTIWLEDSEVNFVEGNAIFFTYLHSQLNGITATDCDDLILTRSIVAPTPWNVLVQTPLNPPNRAGMKATRSTVHAYETVFEGMSGPYRVDGGDGAILDDSFLFAAACTFTGGDNPQCVFCLQPQRHNGNGITVKGGSEVHAASCTFTPGSGTGPPGEPIVGVVHEYAGPTRSYRVREALGKRDEATLIASGRPGEMVFSLRASSPEGSFQPAYGASAVLARPFAMTFEGVIPESGTLTKPIDLPRHGGVDVQYRQGFFVEPSSQAHFASGSMFVRLPAEPFGKLDSRLPR